VGILIVASPGYSRAGPPHCILGLHPENVLQDIQVGKNPAMAQTFRNQFFRVHGNYPTTNFQDSRLDSSSQGPWKDLTLYVLAHFEENLRRLGLYEAVRATCYAIQMSVANFFAIFELFCPTTGAFFTPVGELGTILHEIWEVSVLPMRSLPYEEYFPCEAELALLEK